VQCLNSVVNKETIKQSTQRVQTSAKDSGSTAVTSLKSILEALNSKLTSYIQRETASINFDHFHQIECSAMRMHNTLVIM